MSVLSLQDQMTVENLKYIRKLVETEKPHLLALVESRSDDKGSLWTRHTTKSYDAIIEKHKDENPYHLRYGY